MYQADFICTYKEMDTSEDQEMMYKIQLLQAFALPEWDDQIVQLTIDELYKEMSSDPSVVSILDNVSKVAALQTLFDMTLQTDKDRLCFSLLFQYEYFDLFHNCIIDFTHRGGIREKTLNNLLTTF